METYVDVPAYNPLQRYTMDLEVLQEERSGGGGGEFFTSKIREYESSSSHLLRFCFVLLCCTVQRSS